MAETRTFGRMPTLGEMKEYYAREDVLSFLFDECQMRNVDIAVSRKRWPIEPTSKDHLEQIIGETIESRIERIYRKDSSAVDSVRLKKFDYLSFHARTTIISNDKLIGFDVIFEADRQGWRRAFEELVGVVKVLDDFGVCYRIKYSGVRSLHFMIPFESFPKQFRGESILSQRADIQNRLGDYFRKHCGMNKAHGGGVMRLGYSLNEDNGLVSLPITSDELPDFRPWETNIYNVNVDKPWHGDIPLNANLSMLRFLREVYNDGAKATKRQPQKVSSELKIAPKERSRHSRSSAEEWANHLSSEHESERLEAAWNLMTTPESVPISVVEEGLKDENPDVRWYLTEALQKNLDDKSINIAGRMLWDDDQFVRIGAIDALALSGVGALQAVSDSMSGGVNASIDSMGAIDDVIYAIQKICSEGESEAIRSFIGPIGNAVARFLLNAISSDQPFWAARRYIRRLRELCGQYSIKESVLFHDAIEIIVPRSLNSLSIGELGSDEIWVPYHRIWILQEIRRNKAIPLMTIREIADSLSIDTVKIPSNRMTEEERTFLTKVVRKSLSDMTLEQKANILVAFWQRCGKKLSEPAGNLLLCIEQIDPSIAEWMDKAGVRVHGTKQVGAKELMQGKSIEELIGMLGQNWHIRMPAIHALAEKCESIEDIDAVINAMNSGRNTKARMAAVKALGLMSRHERARKAIREALNAQGATNKGHKFPRWDVRRTALRIYVRSNPPDAVDVLLRAVDEWRSATAIHDAVAECRRFLSDERIVSKLREVLATERFPGRARGKAQRILAGIPG